MSGAGGDRGGRGHGQDGDPYLNPTAAGLLDHNDVDSFFVNNRSPCVAEGGGGGGGVAGKGYSSITDDFLQGFLEDDGAKREMVVGRHDDLLQMMAGGGAPVTPNSSVMSSSNEAIGGDHRPKGSRLEEIDEQGSAADRNCKRKSNNGEEKKKAGEKKPRVAFKTKSEVDHLEDGYRWRKYGQKAVKNSSYPRSYYRCTAARCGVKKLVERSQQDPSSVITTYEGQHTHPCPVGLARTGTAHGLLMQPHGNLTMSPPMRHQLGFVRPDDDLARMMAYAHGVPSSSPAVGTGSAMPPPPVTHLLRPDH